MENYEKFEYLRSELTKLASLAMYYAKHVEDAAFGKPTKEMEVLAYISAAHATIGTVEAIYVSNIELMEHNDIDEFIHRFKTFLDEARTNTVTDHSQQWTDIEFERLNEAYENCVLHS